jgi:ADP-ribose pyrophosphatase YjhB (NUDIX family)
MVKKEIKIYYGSKVIRLTNYFPLTEPADTMVVYYDQGGNLIYRFIEFAEHKSFSTLFLWSGSGYKEMKTQFFSFFKILEAAGGVVKNEKNEILVIFRNGKWDLPKGKIDKRKETIKQAAIREVQEETGLKVLTVTGKLMTTYHLYFRKEKMILKPTCWFEMYADSSNKLIPEAKENISLAAWVSTEEIPGILKNTYHSLEELFNLHQIYQPGI